MGWDKENKDVRKNKTEQTYKFLFIKCKDLIKNWEKKLF